MHAILSIHDVAPDTMERVTRIIASLPEQAKTALILLVIPGLDWKEAQIRQLKYWQDAGIELAGHGWTHQTDKIETLYHKLHSLFVSRDVAEHLSLSSSEICELMQRNRAWFAEQGLNTPACYVPPAWALGRISNTELRATGYQYIENTSGYISVETEQSKTLPLVGFEADTTLRKYVLKVWNALNRWNSSKKRPLRISIHPYDPEYKLASSITDTIEGVEQFVDYTALFQ
jgi:predicted deacetylase